MTRSVRAAAAALALFAACSGAPVRVDRADPEVVQQEITSDILSSDHPSELSTQFLQRFGLYAEYQEDPVKALRQLHQALERTGDRYRLFALSELSYAYAERSNDRSYYLAAAVYAYALLFSELDADPPLDPSDPRLRVACDLYNHGLAEALATGDRGEWVIQAGRHALPFGWIDLDAESAPVSWGGYHLEHFVPAAELQVHGLRNRYRRAGIGAPLIAGLWKEDTDRIVAGHRRIPSNLKVPVTGFLRISDPRAGVVSGRLHGKLEMYSVDDRLKVDVASHEWPLEFETSSALAYTLGESRWWDFEYAGFFSAAVNPWHDKSNRDGLVLVDPYRPGHIPLVLVHGTASSPGRWADLINELEIDDRIASHYQIWLYIYNTGNPIGYSGGVMRETLERAVREFDPRGVDPALHHMVIVGHSQGGLLAKLTVVDSGLAFWDHLSSVPPDQLVADEDTRKALVDSNIFTPEPFVRRVVFVCTPQRGSYLASMSLAGIVESFIDLPSDLTKRLTDVISLNPGKIALQSMEALPTSIDNMRPGSAFIETLASLPVAKGVHAHSIIAREDRSVPLEDSGDGVVKYASAHIDGVESEKIVHSDHSAQGNPETIEEIRRILLLHLQEK